MLNCCLFNCWFKICVCIQMLMNIFTTRYFTDRHYIHVPGIRLITQNKLESRKVGRPTHDQFSVFYVNIPVNSDYTKNVQMGRYTYLAIHSSNADLQASAYFPMDRVYLFSQLYMRVPIQPLWGVASQPNYRIQRHHSTIYALLGGPYYEEHHVKNLQQDG